ncbi:MAG: GLPGLI family protein, partial [Bacteroidia bacterium]
MKLILMLVIALVIHSITSAQTPDKVLARVRYTYSNKMDTLKNQKTRVENMLLFIGKNTSLYTSYDLLNHRISIDQKVINIAKNSVDDGKPKTISIDLSESKWMSPINHLYFFNERKHYIQEMISDQGYIIEEAAAKLNWKIAKDTLSFSGVLCQKATATHQGKNWIAWFSPRLAFQSGPWELNGLPGLIIEAHDEKNEIHFQFAGMENAREGDFKRLRDVTKGVHAEADLINPIDIMMGFDVASAYFNILMMRSGHRVCGS